MKMNPRAWFNRSRIPMNAAENVTFSANDPASESTPRSELFSTVQMERYGQKLARTHKVSSDKHPYYLLKRLGDNEDVITQNCYELNAGKKTSIMPAGEWLLDNYYLIEEQIRTVRQHLPKSFGKGLPSLVSPLNCPRIYHIASEAIAHGDGRWDAASLTSYLTAYQQVTPLTLGEVWALPGMLRLALIENLRRISMEVIKAQQDRNLADTWITRIVECAKSAPGDLIMVVADMARSRPPLTNAFVAELMRRLQGHGNALSLPLTWIDQCLREQGITTDVLIHSFNQQLAASQLSVSNSIAGLRLVSETDWADFAETISVVEQALRNDPAGIYPRMHFNTRDHYRHVVEVLARDSGLSEHEVADRVLALSEEKAPNTPEYHVGYYLAGEGRQALDKLLVDNEGGLIKLLTPPFDGHGPNPGYIQGYLPGVRENGGQYTHGAIWAVMAFARMGNAERAWQLWSMLSPINHTLNADSVGIYKAEPYVMSADVYSVAPHTGRAGWSWYTGSAAWAWRLLTEELLGIKRSGTDFSVHARLPDEWSSFSMAYQYGESHYQISVSRGDAEYCVTLDGVLLPDDRIPLKDDGQNHTVEIIQN